METVLPKRNKKTTHWQVREQGHERLRHNVVEAASNLLVEEGPDALTVRRIAQELECSTKIIYTMFQGKEGLADALYLEGCERLGHLIGQVQWVTNPAEYLYKVAWAYWAFALANPGYYRVMFCGAIPNFHPSQVSIRNTATALETIVESLRRYIEQDMLLYIDDPERITKVLWAPLHGVISLYLLGHFSTLEETTKIFERTVQSLIASLVPKPLHTLS